jgi:Fe-S oxidoreductase
MKHAEILHRCFRCGYCKLPGTYTDFNCPAYAAFRFETYSPGGRMWLLRAYLDKKIRPSKRFQEILFACTACANCVEQCALPKIKDLLLHAFTAGKEELIVQGKVPPSVRDCLTNLQKYGNPYGITQKKRADWARDIDAAPFSDQEYLFFVGDVGSFDNRGQEIARSVAKLLQHMDISFGILGTDEVSDGNEAKAMGEIDLFQWLAHQNIEQFKKLQVQKVITLSPHGFNALKNSYPELGLQLEVFHYSQIVANQIYKLAFRKDLPQTRITYHDPCYLGRHNWEYQSARNILGAIPGVEYQEMDRHHQDAMCCGGGGGNLFTDILGSAPESATHNRIREALETQALILAVSCPVCAIMLSDAVKSLNADNHLQVMELSEIINARLAAGDHPATA